MGKTDSQVPDSPLVVREIDISKCASEDALLDGTDDLFQAFKARLTSWAAAVTEKHVAGTATNFREWTGKTGERFVEMAGNIPANLDIDALETDTMGKLAATDTPCSTKIIHLEKEKHRWHERFPELGLHLDKPQEKNAFLLGGFVLFLIAVESIANSRFFAEGSELGLLGGTLIAITVSLGNVCIPLVLAFFGHRWFYRYDAWRIYGGIMIGLFLLWAFGFNHLVAQYRESLVAVSGAGSSDSSTLNYVLLFALGAAVAGISFWKMWSFLDPFEHARKCLNDLKDTKKEFEDAVCADLREARNKYKEINSKINMMGTEIPSKFQEKAAEFNLVHGTSIDETNRWFSDYHKQYCVMKVDPDPELPVVTPETATEYKVGVTQAEWDFFNAMKTLLNEQINTATNEWIPKLHDILAQINDLIRRFKEVITAKLLEWENQARPA